MCIVQDINNQNNIEVLIYAKKSNITNIINGSSINKSLEEFLQYFLRFKILAPHIFLCNLTHQIIDI